MNIRTIIVDDEPKAIEILERYLAKIPFISLLNSFRDPLDALTFFRENKIDLILLDINMPNISGIEFSKLTGAATQIIFTTAYPEYAVHGFDLNATDYLLKPIEFNRFVIAINKVSHALQNNISTRNTFAEDILFFKSGTKVHKTNINDILFFKKEGNYFTVNLKNEKNILIRINFADLMDHIPQQKFLRVHKSYIVAINNIDLIDTDVIHIDKHRIPVGLNYKSNLDFILSK